MSYSAKHIVAVFLCMTLAFVLIGCESPKPQAVKTVTGAPCMRNLLSTIPVHRSSS